MKGVATGIRALPRFFFDVRDNNRFTRDPDGTELAGVEAARTEASRTLGEIAKETLPVHERCDVAITVRDDADHLILRAGLRFDVTRF